MLDVIIRNGLIATESGVLPAGQSIGISNGKISVIGSDLPEGPETKIIDAQGAYITPGGVDSHVHLAQRNAPTGDNWETGTRSAVAGGTTTVLAFASQTKEMESLFPVLEDYHNKSREQCYCDYGFHFVLTNPTAKILNEELPVIAKQEGITSVKLYMTYELYKLSDRQLLETMLACQSLGLTTMIHAENSDIIEFLIQGLERNGHTDPFFHAIAGPKIAEDEASYRAIRLAELVGAPVLLVHVSSDGAMKHIRDAQTRLLPIHAETCPHYLFLLSDKLAAKEHDAFHGARGVCSPPLRHHVEDLEALWNGIANDTFTVFSSDHAPTKYDHPQGKKAGIINGIPKFSKIPKGIPGIETRLSLLFSESEGCLPRDQARLSVERFVQLTSGNPARLYGLKSKGAIMPGLDADLVIWHPENQGERIISQDNLHHDVDYTPFEGMRVRNWPRFTILRGELVWNADENRVTGVKGFGKYLKRDNGRVLVGKLGRQPAGMIEGERDLWRPKTVVQ
ncbi:Hydantoinase/dihydropyrimidinase [Penicillium expansum]|nr:Hydantoinase/dihydropyrimidinase [Penicillium expansum]